MTVHHTKGIALMRTAFSYTHCTDLCSSLTYITLRVPQTVYIKYEVPLRPLQQVYDLKINMAVPHPKVSNMTQTAFSFYPLYVTGATECVHQLLGPVVGRGYSKCTIPKACMAVHNTKKIALTLTAFSYTRHTDLHSSMMYIALRVTQTVYTNYEVRWHPLQQRYDS